MNTKPLRMLMTANLLLAALLAGCATTKIDWSARVGNYTFDQAVLELGPPDKQARLENGTVVADWLTHRGHRAVYSPPPIYPYSGSGYDGPYYFGGYADSYSPDYFLRLTFGPDRKLSSWKKFAR